MDRAAYILLIIYDTHPTHTVRREARGHISFSPPRRHFYTILSTPRESNDPNYPQMRVSLAESLRGVNSPEHGTLELIERAGMRDR